MDQHEYQAQIQVIIRLQALLSVGLPVILIIPGMAKDVLLVLDMKLVLQNQQIHRGTQYQVLLKHGMDQHEYQVQIQVIIRLQALLSVDISVAVDLPGTAVAV